MDILQVFFRHTWTPPVCGVHPGSRRSQHVHLTNDYSVATESPVLHKCLQLSLALWLLHDFMTPLKVAARTRQLYNPSRALTTQKPATPGWVHVTEALPYSVGTRVQVQLPNKVDYLGGNKLYHSPNGPGGKFPFNFKKFYRSEIVNAHSWMRFYVDLKLLWRVRIKFAALQVKIMSESSTVAWLKALLGDLLLFSSGY